MKKSIYRPYLILLTLLLVPLTACTTKTAAEKPQDPPSRQEQPAADTRTGDAPTQQAQPATVETQPSKPAMQLDAVSGATVDTVSGATISQRQQKRMPASEVVEANKNMATSGAAVAKKQRTPAAPAGKTAGQKNTAAGKTAGKAEPTTAAGELKPADSASNPDTAAGELQPAASASNPDTAAADEPVQPAPAAIAKAVESTTPPAATANTAAEQVPTAPSAGEPVPLAAAADTSDTPALSAEPNVPAYETTLADLITDFEQQGGTHGYEPPPTFHEEMQDLFSPQIFTVAFSKEPETEQKPKVSRMVAVEEKQRLELTYPGHGWVYVGEQTSQPGLKYEQRKLQDNTSIFMFTAEKKGDYILHFSYFDVFTNEFVTDAVAVSVSAARSTAAKSTVKAPDYQNEVGEAETTQAQKNTQAAASQPSSGSAGNTGTGTTTQTAQAASEAPQTAGSGSQSKTTEQTIAAGTTEAASSAAGSTGDLTAQNSAAADAEVVLSSDQLLEKARTAIAAADAGTALTYLDNFFTTAEEKLDEGWFLKGRAYELNGSVRNIRLALDAYRTLTDSFPQSKYWAEADARIRYITGFYINIR